MGGGTASKPALSLHCCSSSEIDASDIAEDSGVIVARPRKVGERLQSVSFIEKNDTTAGFGEPDGTATALAEAVFG